MAPQWATGKRKRDDAACKGCYAQKNKLKKRGHAAQMEKSRGLEKCQKQMEKHPTVWPPKTKRRGWGPISEKKTRIVCVARLQREVGESQGKEGFALARTPSPGEKARKFKKKPGSVG